jgi:hypothetical protein
MESGVSPFAAPELRIDQDFDVEAIKTAFSDSTISSHFLYITAQDSRELDITDGLSAAARGVQWQEVSQDIYSAFREVAAATGGLVESSSNPASAFRKAVDASENYYLLYYSPADYRPDGRFRSIRVEIKGKDYKVLHRAGYIAD